MNFFENTRKPQGFGGKLMAKMMNSGHAKVSQWGFSNISAKPEDRKSTRLNSSHTRPSRMPSSA